MVACSFMFALVMVPHAEAHSAPPTIVTSIESVLPMTPPGVVLGVTASVADELVASNSTATALEVISSAGEPFLRISSRGVLANVSSPDWWTTNDPLGSLNIPPGARVGAAAHWLLVSHRHQWEWFDHRMHPSQQEIPIAVVTANRDALLLRWVVPMKYAGAPLEVRGRVDFEPVRGAYLVTVDPSTPGDPQPEEITAQILQGRLPGIRMTSSRPTSTVTVFDPDGQIFAQIGGPAGTRVWTGSATWIADQRARAIPPDGRDPGVGPNYKRVSNSAELTWLDPRLRAASARPNAAILARSTPTRVSTWRIGVSVDSRKGDVHGAITWVPNADSATETAREPGSTRTRDIAIGAGVLVLAVGAGAYRSRSRARRRSIG